MNKIIKNNEIIKTKTKTSKSKNKDKNHKRKMRQMTSELNTKFAFRGDVIGAEKFLLEIRRSGFKPNIFTYNILIKCYIKAHQIAESDQILERMKEDGVHPDVISINTIASGYMKLGKVTEAKEFFKKYSSIQPNEVTFGIRMKGVRNLKEGNALLYEMEARGINVNEVISNSLLLALVSANEIEEALFYLSKMKKTGLRSYTIVMQGLVAHNRLEEAVNMLHELSKTGRKLDTIIFSAILNAYASKGMVVELRSVLSFFMPNSGCRPNLDSFHILMKCYSNLIPPDTAACEGVLNEILYHGLEPTTATYTNLMDIYCKIGKPNKAEEILITMKKGDRRIQPNEASYNTLVKGYAKCRCKLTQGYCQCIICYCSSPEEGERVINEMIESGLQPNIITYNTLLDSFVASQNIEKAEQLFLRMKLEGATAHHHKKRGVTPNNTTYNTLIKGYVFKCQNMDKAMALLQEMSMLKDVSPTLTTFNTIIDAYCGEGRLSDALTIVDALMVSSDLRPDTTMCNTLLKGCRNTQRKPKDAWKIFNEMLMKHNVTPDITTYNILLDVLIRSKDCNYIEIAFDIWNCILDNSSFGMDFIGGISYTTTTVSITPQKFTYTTVVLALYSLIQYNEDASSNNTNSSTNNIEIISSIPAYTSTKEVEIVQAAKDLLIKSVIQMQEVGFEVEENLIQIFRNISRS